MENEIAELEKTGATELAAKFREAWKTHSTSADTLKAEHTAAASKLKAAERDLAKYKGDLESAGKGTDERVTKLTQERDALKKSADDTSAAFDSFKLRVALGGKLGIADEVTRKRAVDAFLADHRPENAGLDEKGNLQGFDAAIDAFKKAEPIWFNSQDPSNGGGRLGSDPAPKVGADKKPAAGSDDEKVAEWSKALYPPKEGARK